MEQGYLRQINQEIEDFSKDITIVPSLTFNQKATLEQIYFYYLSRFKTGDIDTEGDKKYFYNIVKTPCKVMTKMIDFDTKHIRILSEAGTNPHITWFFERDLKQWMKEVEFGKVLNRIFRELPIFGTVVLKMIGDRPYFVDLRNFIVNPAADSLEETPIIERHYYTPDGLKKVGKQLGWKNIDQAIEQYRDMDKKGKFICVYERYGEIYRYKSNGEREVSNRRVVIADVGEDKRDRYTSETVPHNGVVLDDEEYDGYPYREFHLEKMPGRWLGIGVVEMLFDPQMRHNELANQMAKGTYWASLRLFQTADDATNINLSTDAINGQILNNSGFPITPIDLTERNLAYFAQEFERWTRNRDETTFTFEIPRGERSPAGTTLGEIQILAQSAYNYFGHIQENVALDIKRFLFDDIIPSFQKKMSKEHFLRLVGEDLEKINEILVATRTQAELFSFIARNGKLPLKEHFDIIKAVIEEKIKTGEEKILKIPKETYKGIKYKLEIDITGESKDTRVYTSALFAALQAITTDPTILQDPRKRKLFMKWMESVGLDVGDLPPSQEKGLEGLMKEGAPQTRAPGRAGAGGGVSRPNMPQGPIPGEKTTSL